MSSVEGVRHRKEAVNQSSVVHAINLNSSLSESISVSIALSRENIILRCNQQCTRQAGTVMSQYGRSILILQILLSRNIVPNEPIHVTPRQGGAQLVRVISVVPVRHVGDGVDKDLIRNVRFPTVHSHHAYSGCQVSSGTAAANSQ